MELVSTSPDRLVVKYEGWRVSPLRLTLIPAQWGSAIALSLLFSGFIEGWLYWVVLLVAGWCVCFLTYSPPSATTLSLCRFCSPTFAPPSYI